ncbi:MAG TPA: hypothetical protein PLP29_12475 [Candidatus Ozemobacteraceae bacterium]|nr:hypothetical protein [Candidatus Ozemobacteraceae bacterium]
MKHRVMIVVLGISLLAGSPAFASSGSDNGLKGLLKRCIEWVKTTFDLGDSPGASASSDSSSVTAPSESDASETASSASMHSGRSPGAGYPDRKSELLSRFDADGDGKLSKSEMAAAVQERKQEILETYDADGDGSLSDSEKETMRKNPPKRHGRPGAPPDGLASGSADFKDPYEEFLKTYDTDGDGLLNDTEKAAADAAREQELLSTYDADGDGALSDSEKETMMKDAPRGGRRGGFPPPPHDWVASGSGDAGWIPPADTTVTGTSADTGEGDHGVAVGQHPWSHGPRNHPTREQIEARKQAMIEMYDEDGDGALNASETANAKSIFQGYYEEISQEADQ